MIMAWILGILLALGGLMTFFAALGLLRMPDVILRMHGATKAGTLGVGLIAVVAGVYFGLTKNDARPVIEAALVFLFLIFTAPIGAHLIGRASLRAKVDILNEDD